MRLQGRAVRLDSPPSMQLPIVCRWAERVGGRPVRGGIRLAEELDLLAWTRWRYDRHDEDKTWDWWGILTECRASSGRYECYAALAGGELQALMVLDLTGRRSGKRRWVVVDYLSTNPANRVLTGGLKHVGTAMIAVAIRRSLERGDGGRIWLDSLPGAAGFYQSLGMVRRSRRSAEGNHVYTLDPSGAKQLLDEIRERGIVNP